MKMKMVIKFSTFLKIIWFIRYLEESNEETKQIEDKNDDENSDNEEINEKDISERLSKYLNIGDQVSNENKLKIIELDWI